MGSSRILKNAVTIYKPLGEDTQGRMQWRRIVFDKVYFEASRAVSDGSHGSRPSDTTVLYIFSERSIAYEGVILYTAGEICEHLFAVVSNRDDFEDDRMYLALSKCDSEAPPKGSLLIKRVQYFKAGSCRMWHWEVEAR